MSHEHEHESPHEGECYAQPDAARVRIEAPAGVDPLLIAQALVGDDWLIKAERAAPKERNPFKAHGVLADLYDHAMRAYEEQTRSMLAAMSAYVEENVGLELAKATRAPRPLFTVEQVRALAKIIRDNHTALSIGLLGTDAATKSEIQRLIRLGIVPKGTEKIIDDAFLYGRLLTEINLVVRSGTTTVPKVTLAEMKKRLKARPVPLTPTEEAAVSAARQHAATYVRGLGNRIADDFSTMAIEADKRLRAKYAATITETVAEGVARRDAWRKIASTLGHKTGDWARDFGRIAATEKTRAMQEGYATRLRAREGEAALVAKIPSPKACDHCVRLHLVAGVGSRPRTFRLRDLEANGTNVGRKAGEWRAVVGPTHPWCECALVHVPPGWAFDGDGNLMPERTRKSWTLAEDLRKAMSFGDSVPEQGIVVRVGDPEKVAIIEEVLRRTPPALFTRTTGVTLITTDHPSEQSHLEAHDFAYWTGNEIRLLASTPKDKLRRIVEHEIGHALNVYLMHKFGGVDDVRKWHDKLFAISKREGFVSDYAEKSPIENAAEVSRLYLYARAALMQRCPKQFAFCHESYRDLFRADKRADVFGESPEAQVDALDFRAFTARLGRAAAKHGLRMHGLSNGAIILTTHESTSGPKVALLSGLHGEERAGPIALLTWLERTRTLPKDVRLWICPLLSRRTWDSRERAPGGTNLNRVWNDDAAPPIVADAMASLRAFKPDVFLDLHEEQTITDGRAAVHCEVPAGWSAHFAAMLGAKATAAPRKHSSESFVRSIGCKRTGTVETAQTEPLATRVNFQAQAIALAIDSAKMSNADLAALLGEEPAS